MTKGLKELEKIKNIPTIYVGCISDVYTMCPIECRVIEEELKALEVIIHHKLLNYVIKNKKCAKMYGLSDEKLKLLEELMNENI